MKRAAQPRLVSIRTEKVVIKEISSSAAKLVIKFEGGEITLPPHVYVHQNDSLELKRDSNNNLLTAHKLVFDPLDKSDSKVALYPAYQRFESLSIPPHKLSVRFFERTEPSSWREAKRLEQFHYRGMGLNKIVGRRSVLMADVPGFGIVGYGVVSASVAAAKPRFKILGTNFQELMKTKFINKLVRIPRIVIHPEFRGVGLGMLMARHLVEYVRKHWDVRGYRPVMVEVIAAMTEYHRFFESAGFIFAGVTEGYRGLAIKPRYGTGGFEPRNNTEHYRFMVNQGPKPYLAFPLNGAIRRKIQKFVKHQKSDKMVSPRTPILDESLKFLKVSAAYKSRNGLSQRATSIKESFGVDGNQMLSVVLKQFSLKVEPGDCVLLTGASGSGKTTLLKLLSETRTSVRKNLMMAGDWPKVTRKIATFSKTFAKKSLIDQVGGELKDGIRLLNSIGLAEARLYLKRPNQLSEGQRYRFSIALLCASASPIWVADEFASTLDPLNAAIVAKGLRRLAYERGVTCFVAAAHIDNFLASLIPNVLVHLRWGGLADITILRASYRSRGSKWFFRVVNAGTQPLNDIVLVGIDELGRQKSLAEPVTLLKGEFATLSVKSSACKKLRVIKIVNDVGIGEVFYLREQQS